MKQSSRIVVFAFLLIGAVLQSMPAAVASPSVQALGTGEPALTPADLAQDLAGSGVTVSNVSYTGAAPASGRFSGGGTTIGLESGVLLTSGNVNNVVGPNDSDGAGQANGAPGDADLNALLPSGTSQDASVLEFDFIPDESPIFFRYVFGSEEYNEFVYGGFNDVFGFFLGDENEVNCAVVPGTETPVSIDTINGGNPFGSTNASHPELYRNNDLEDGGGSIDTELDGLTTILICTADVVPDAINHVKLAIADVGDSSLDSAVFLEAGSFSTTPPPSSISGTVVDDADGDGEIGEGEGGLASATVTLFEPGQDDVEPYVQVGDPVTTGEDGGWSFPDLAAGTYRVVETNPDGYVSTAAVAGNGAVVVDADTIDVVLTGEGDSTGNAFLDQAEEQEAEADLSIDKTDEPDPVTAGGALLYTLTVTNHGPDPATNVEVVDTLPAGTEFESAEGDGWFCDDSEGEGGTVVTCTRESLAVGETAVIEILVTTSSELEDGTELTNVASVSSDEFDPDEEDEETDNVSEETTTVRSQATADFASEFCPDGCTVTTDTGTGASPGDPTVTTVIVPEGTPPQTVTITEAAATTDPDFCGGATCSGQLVTISDIVGVTDQNEPIIVEITYDKTVKGGSQVYISKDGGLTRRLVDNCKRTGIANPHPCVSSKRVLANGDRMFTILMLSGDPILGKK